MLTQAEIVEREQIALDKCADYESTLTEITFAGLENPAVDFSIYDIDGKPWPIPPCRMTVRDIFQYVGVRFGPLFESFARQHPNFILH
jgi:hypothetical protein